MSQDRVGHAAAGLRSGEVAVRPRWGSPGAAPGPPRSRPPTIWRDGPPGSASARASSPRRRCVVACSASPGGSPLGSKGQALSPGALVALPAVRPWLSARTGGADVPHQQPVERAIQLVLRGIGDTEAGPQRALPDRAVASLEQGARTRAAMSASARSRLRDGRRSRSAGRSSEGASRGPPPRGRGAGCARCARPPRLPAGSARLSATRG